MVKRIGRTQRKIVAAMLVVGFLPGAVGIFFTYLSGTVALKETIGANFQALAGKTAGKIDSIINNEIGDARALSISPIIASTVREANKGDHITGILNREVTNYIKRYKGQRGKDIISIAVIDKRGGIVATTGKSLSSYQPEGTPRQELPPPLPFPIKGEEGGRERAFVGGINFDKTTQIYSMSMAIPIIDENTGERTGGLMVVYNIQDIFRNIVDVGIGKTGHANLVTSDGTLLICPLFPPQSHTVNTDLLRQISTTQPGWGVAPNDAHGGKNSIIGFSPVKTTLQMGKDNFGGKRWYVFIRQLPEETFAPLYTLLWRVSILGSLLVTLLSLLGYYLARKIVRPIKLLSESARLIGQGHLDQSIKVTTGDEIEELADIFNQMVKDLDRRFQEIRLERDKLNTVMNNIDGLVIIDQDLKIQYMNEKFLRLYGKESIGRPCYEVLRIGDRTCEGCSLREEKDIIPHTLEVVTDEGRTYLVTRSSIRNMDGTLSFLDIYRDITERKRLEQKLLYSERLTALSQFSSTFAHDLRNPIIAIKKTIQMLKDSPASPREEETKRVYDDIISACGLLLGLVNDVLDMHQVSYRDLPLLYSSFSLNQALEEVVKLLESDSEERRIHVEIEGSDRDVWIEGDRRRIQRVFINLLSNALKYSPSKGNVTISFDTSIPPEASGTANLLFKIGDEGPGIAPAELSKIFDLFYKTDESGIKPGIGLGLYFCRVVVEAHGGRIWAGNRENGGAIFYIEMPLVRREADAYKDSLSR